jgi:hypothetical protein
MCGEMRVVFLDCKSEHVCALTLRATLVRCVFVRLIFCTWHSGVSWIGWRSGVPARWVVEEVLILTQSMC